MKLHTATPPRTGTRVHLAELRVGQKVMLRTTCGRWLEDRWLVRHVSPRLAVAEVTCTRCAPQARRWLQGNLPDQ